MRDHRLPVVHLVADHVHADHAMRMGDYVYRLGTWDERSAAANTADLLPAEVSCVKNTHIVEEKDMTDGEISGHLIDVYFHHGDIYGGDWEVITDGEIGEDEMGDAGTQHLHVRQNDYDGYITEKEGAWTVSIIDRGTHKHELEGTAETHEIARETLEIYQHVVTNGDSDG